MPYPSHVVHILELHKCKQSAGPALSNALYLAFGPALSNALSFTCGSHVGAAQMQTICRSCFESLPAQQHARAMPYSSRLVET
eukprot:52548-Pelagomonas_calceolata.AAC.1